MLHPMETINAWWKSLNAKQRQKIRDREHIEHYDLETIKDPKKWYGRLRHIHRNGIYIKYRSIYYKKKGGKKDDIKSIPREHGDDRVPA